MTDHSLDACLRLLADRHRRRIIDYLRHEAGGSATFDDLVTQLYSRGVDSGDDSPRGREELVIQLHLTHLPTLADHGVVEYDHRSGAVRYHPDEQAEAVLDSLPEDVSVPRP